MTWPTTGLPLPEDRANTTDSTDNHPLDHSTIAGVINSYISALGKVDPTGYTNLPTLFDPDNAAWDDGMFLQVGYAAATGQQFTWGGINATDTPGAIAPLFTIRGESADGNHYAYARFGVTAPINAGTGSGANFLLNSSDLAGLIAFSYTDALSQVEIQANTGQTDPLLLLEDASGTDIFKLAPDGTVGGVTPNVGDSIKWDGTKWVAQA